MKRINHLYETICTFEHLYKAANDAAIGKKKRACVNDFLLNLEPFLWDLKKDLENKTYCPGIYDQFILYDPKKRTISAAPFRDRVVHHAICLLLEPVLERYFIFHSYACRKDKGMHRALEVAKNYALRYPYFLKMDVAKFYDSVSHSILKDRLRRIIKDKDFLWLLDTILDTGPCTMPQTGLPVGNLTSQYFANFLLSGLDHYAKETLQIKPYLRYMDDFLLFAEEKQDLQYCQKAFEEYLPKELHLNWKEKATVLAPVTEGAPFLGFRLFPGYCKIQKKNWKRFKKKFQKRQEEFQQGEITLQELQLSIESMTSHVMQANTRRLRGEFFVNKGWDL